LTLLTVNLSANEVVKTTLYVQSKRVYNKSDILNYKGRIYLPLRDTLNALDGRIELNRKDRTYSLDLFRFKKEVLFKTGSKNIWINKQRHTLNAPIRQMRGRIYVPMDSFFSTLGFTLQKQGANWIINFSNNSTGYTATSASSQKYSHFKEEELTHAPEISIIASSGDHSKKIDSIDSPPVNNLTKFDIQIADKTLTMRQRALYKQNIVFIEASNIFESEGWAIKTGNRTYSLSKGDRQVFFKTNSSEVQIHEGSTIRKITMEHSPINHNNHILIPLKGVVNILEMNAKWISHKNTLVLMSQLTQVNAIRTEGEFSVELKSPTSLYVDTAKLDLNKNSATITLFNTQSLVEKNILRLKEGPLSEIVISQQNQTDSSITLKYRKKPTLPTVQSSSKGAQIYLANSIIEFKEVKSGSYDKVKIKMTAPIEPAIYRLPNPRRLILDFPNSYSKIPQINNSKSNAYSKLRASQFTWKPPKTRIVFDLKDKNKLITSKRDGNQYELLFTSIQSTPKSSPKSTSLKGKIIAIDPGHGGRDPGAVGKKGRHEKYYTMDISLRLKQLLEAKGADVILVRKGDQNPSLYQRTIAANRNKADAFISVHVNSFYNSFANGTETYYYKASDKPLAQAIQNEMVKTLKRKNLGTKRAKLYVLRYSTMPTALVEPLFITNHKEYQLLIQPVNRQKIAQAIETGISKYFKSR
jgi:N-acetylmuramoyl-L-alanine amidase